MHFLDHLRAKPEAERRKLFWLALAAALLVFFGLWTLAFRATVKTLSLESLKEAVAPEAETRADDPSLWSAALGQRLDTLRRLIPFAVKAVPGREEIIK